MSTAAVPALDRRAIVRAGLALAGAAFLNPHNGMAQSGSAPGTVRRQPGVRLRIGLNAYSFNRPLLAGNMTLDQVVDYCAAQNIDGLDATGYYFRGYPEIPSDDIVYALKRRAFVNGVTISGTGVRNDFCAHDASARAGQIRLVKNWTGVARKLGASVVRVFSGPAPPRATASTKSWNI